MKKFDVTYYFFDLEDELRHLIIEANTLQDAALIFNLNYGNQVTMVKIEEHGDNADALDSNRSI